MEPPRYRPHPPDKHGSHSGYRGRGPPQQPPPPPPRRRRPSLWDSREYPYGIPVPPPRGAILPAAAAVPRASHIPAAEVVVVRAPEPHEKGPLAGIDIPALSALLNGVDPVASASTEYLAGGSTVGSASTAPTAPWAVRGARRLYVGNLPDGTTETAVQQFFNEALRTSKASLGDDDPVVTTYLKMEKRFAFIELRTVSEAVACLMLDGLPFQGMPLRIRRPNDFPATAMNAQPPATFDPSILGLVCTQVPDSANKLFIGGIPYHLTEDQVKELLTTYGRLAAFNLVKEQGTGLSKGYAFCEYADLKVVDQALAGLNGMKIEDKTLTVRRASLHAGSGPEPVAIMPAPVVGNTIPAAQVPSGQLLGSSTRVLELRNVIVEEDELRDDEEYEEICEEMREEGQKYGKLEKVVVPRPVEGEDKAQAEARGVGRVFLKYATNAECERAHVTLSGRKFDQRIVRAAFYDEAKFENSDFA